MRPEELKTNLKKIWDSGEYEPEIYVSINNSQMILKEFCSKVDLKYEIRDKILNPILKDILLSSVEFSDITLLDNSLDTYYFVQMDDVFHPFDFVNQNVDKKYMDDEQLKIKGFFFKISLGDEFFWAYQNKYSTTYVNRISNIYTILTQNDEYELLNQDVVRFDKKIDLLIYKDFIITNNINLLEKEFNFKDHIVKEANTVFEKITSIGIIEDVEKLKNVVADTSKLTVHKKLMKIKKSKIINFSKDELYSRLKSHRFYKNLFKFNESNKTIKITNNTDVRNLLKMFNDEILYSELLKDDIDINKRLEFVNKPPFDTVWANILANQNTDFSISPKKIFRYTVANENELTIIFNKKLEKSSKENIERAYNQWPIIVASSFTEDILLPNYIYKIFNDIRIIAKD